MISFLESRVGLESECIEGWLSIGRIRVRFGIFGCWLLGGFRGIGIGFVTENLFGFDLESANVTEFATETANSTFAIAIVQFDYSAGQAG